MSARSYAAADSATMLRRSLRHALRYPSMTVSVVGMPIIMLLLFVDVFGGPPTNASDPPGAATTTHQPPTTDAPSRRSRRRSPSWPSSCGARRPRCTAIHARESRHPGS